MNRPTPRRKDTRERIQAVALQAFSERGYDKTSLRGITDQLGITKAALYYYFQAKEDILASLFDDLYRRLDELIDWGRRQPRTNEAKQELLRRYSRTLVHAAPILSLAQENQATLRETTVGQRLQDRVSALAQLVVEPDAPLIENVRGITALLTVYFGPIATQDLPGDPEEKQRAVLDVAAGLLAQGPGGGPPPGPDAAPDGRRHHDD
ncbi:HTH-type transcriptional regulator MtrR [Micromonospora sp. MW-13]|uniref:SaqK n=1 Tax=Micromonospora sp. Tu 6368 TaxID=428986 RepID=C4NYL4_9ACTN|nr:MULTISPECIES: TetR/AcrR family transcriptional regulator [unclassified Micromonospora]ACP19368.1 SaqK [Micromonospora sp. Tu 6368]MCX4469504.1 TetR/AcrR family transcriptional regulator [Micromonospora sp. NBC_01655]RGC65127.1 HTH-type transcriptional regulator MtrR [Micromonospora sp. MW-13]